MIKSIPPIKNYDYDPEEVFYLNSHYNDYYSYSNVIEKVLGPSSEFYDKLVKGLTDEGRNLEGWSETEKSELSLGSHARMPSHVVKPPTEMER